MSSLDKLLRTLNRKPLAGGTLIARAGNTRSAGVPGAQLVGRWGDMEPLDKWGTINEPFMGDTPTQDRNPTPRENRFQPVQDYRPGIHPGYGRMLGNTFPGFPTPPQTQTRSVFGEGWGQIKPNINSLDAMAEATAYCPAPHLRRGFPSYEPLERMAKRLN